MLPQTWSFQYWYSDHAMNCSPTTSAGARMHWRLFISKVC